MEKPSFYAIIPANVRYAKITPNAKLLYGEITALCNKNGYCFATNEYFANLYDVSKISISKWIKELVDNGFIKSDIEYKEGTKQILNRYIRIVYDPIKEIFNTPIKEKFKDNNTYNNNTFNKEKIYKKESFIKPTIQDIFSYCQERKNSIDANQFFDYYECIGWKVGNKPMKDWKACVRTWERKNKSVDNFGLPSSYLNSLNEYDL